MPPKTKYYAVACGRRPGVYEDWDVCNEQVDRYPRAKFKSFFTNSEAESYLERAGISVKPGRSNSSLDLEIQSQSSDSAASSGLSLESPSGSELRGRKRARTDSSSTPEEPVEEKLKEVSIAEIVEILGGRREGDHKVILPAEMFERLSRLDRSRRAGA